MIESIEIQTGAAQRGVVKAQAWAPDVPPTGDFGQAFSKLAESPLSKRVNTGNFRIVHLCLLRANLFRSMVSYAPQLSL